MLIIILCSESPEGDELHDLIARSHRLGLEIVSAASGHSVHVYTTTHDAESMDDIGLKQCVCLAGLHDLFRQELKQNWGKLSHSAGDWLRGSLLEEIEEKPLRIERSTEDSDCVLDGKCGGKEDHWFTEYVSPSLSLEQYIITYKSSLKLIVGKPHYTPIQCCILTKPLALRSKGKPCVFDLFIQHDLPEIYSWFEDLTAAHPQYLTVNTSIGKTHHNTHIMAVHITDKSEPQRKIKVYFQCLLHARKTIF